MENPEVKWKQFLFIPGGSRVEAKSCWCQRPVCSWAFTLLPFFPPIILLPGPKTQQLGGWFFLELLKMACGLFYPISNCAAFCGAWGERGHLYAGRSCPWLCHSRVLPSRLCSCGSAFGNCTNLWQSSSPSNLWSFVIVCQRFLKIVVLLLSQTKTDYKLSPQWVASRS